MLVQVMQSADQPVLEKITHQLGAGYAVVPLFITFSEREALRLDRMATADTTGISALKSICTGPA
jgi:hypothetical protein